ncbi:MAG: hypothetical protein JWR09_835 [Mucilaginibacter sp.]|nr:hypothetical protein [Mucilaginibacter sp.]
MKNIILFFLIPLISPLCLSAQFKTLSVDQISEHVEKNLRDNYHPDSVAVSKLCMQGCIFVKFNVDNQGRIANLSFSKDSATFIISGLTNAIRSLEKDPVLIKTLKRLGKAIVLPCIYEYYQGCTAPKIHRPATTEDKLKFVISYYRMMTGANRYLFTLSDMLNFEDGKRKGIDCILLNPFEVLALSGGDY